MTPRRGSARLGAAQNGEGMSILLRCDHGDCPYQAWVTSKDLKLFLVGRLPGWFYDGGNDLCEKHYALTDAARRDATEQG